MDIPEIDFNIALQADNNTVNVLQRVNSYFNQLINDDFFWRARIELYYGTNFTSWLPPRYSWKNWYLLIPLLNDDIAITLKLTPEYMYKRWCNPQLLKSRNLWRVEQDMIEMEKIFRQNSSTYPLYRQIVCANQASHLIEQNRITDLTNLLNMLRQSVNINTDAIYLDDYINISKLLGKANWTDYFDRIFLPILIPAAFWSDLDCFRRVFRLGQIEGHHVKSFDLTDLTEEDYFKTALEVGNIEYIKDALKSNNQTLNYFISRSAIEKDRTDLVCTEVVTKDLYDALLCSNNPRAALQYYQKEFGVPSFCTSDVSVLSFFAAEGYSILQNVDFATISLKDLSYLIEQNYLTSSYSSLRYIFEGVLKGNLDLLPILPIEGTAVNYFLSKAVLDGHFDIALYFLIKSNYTATIEIRGFLDVDSNIIAELIKTKTEPFTILKQILMI